MGELQHLPFHHFLHKVFLLSSFLPRVELSVVGYLSFLSVDLQGRDGIAELEAGCSLLAEECLGGLILGVRIGLAPHLFRTIELGGETVDSAEAINDLLVLADHHLIGLLVVGESDAVMIGLLVELGRFLDD